MAFPSRSPSPDLFRFDREYGYESARGTAQAMQSLTTVAKPLSLSIAGGSYTFLSLSLGGPAITSVALIIAALAATILALDVYAASRTLDKLAQDLSGPYNPNALSGAIEMIDTQRLFLLGCLGANRLFASLRSRLCSLDPLY